MTGVGVYVSLVMYFQCNKRHVFFWPNICPHSQPTLATLRCNPILQSISLFITCRYG